MTGCTLIFVFTESRENQHCSRHWLEDIGRQLCRRCPSWLFLDTMSVLHCTDTFHHRDSASPLPILSQSLFCLGLPVSFFICLFLFALSLGFPVVCALVMPPSVQCHAAAAWNSSAKTWQPLSLSQPSAGWPSKRSPQNPEWVHSQQGVIHRVREQTHTHTHTHKLIHAVGLGHLSEHFYWPTFTVERFWFKYVLTLAAD